MKLSTRHNNSTGIADEATNQGSETHQQKFILYLRFTSVSADFLGCQNQTLQRKLTERVRIAECNILSGFFFFFVIYTLQYGL
jgi:hypothetical protein